MSSLKTRILGSPPITALSHALGTPLCVGIAYHGTTARPLMGVNNTYGRFADAVVMESHLSFITRHFRVVELAEIVQRLRTHEPLPRRSVFLTFDDCYAGNYHLAFPLLKKFGVTATFFAPTALIGSGVPFALDIVDAAVKHTRVQLIEIFALEEMRRFTLADENSRTAAAIELHELFKRIPRDEQRAFLEHTVRVCGFDSPEAVPLLGDHVLPMTWDHIKEMHRAGMEFGSHTAHHTVLAEVSDALVREELSESKSALEKQLGEPCRCFCYPVGHYPRNGDERTNRIVQECGYEAAVFMDGGVNTSVTDPYFITRECFGQYTTLPQVAAMLSAAGNRVRLLLGRDRSPHARARKRSS